MSGQILRFDDSAHRAADAVLPWFVNGTLEDDELAVVEQHLRECARCRREVELLKQLHAVCAIDEPVPDALPAYRRLCERIGDTRRFGALRGHWRGLLRGWQSAPGWARWVIAAQCAGMAAFAVWVTPVGDDASAPYRTLGAPAAAAASVGTIAVVFVPDAKESELRRVITAAGARIVDGPTESSAYVLQVPAGNRERILATLRADSAVVLAQPLTAQPDR